ncbi:MAG TPA: hypothetical protein VI299_01065 [Polyangiales bacterium]
MVPEVSVAPLTAETSEGRAWVWVAAPNLVLTQVEGRMAMNHAELVMGTVDLAAKQRPGQVALIHDFTAVDSYEVLVHARMSTWAVNITRSLRRVVIGASSPLVALAVRTVNLAASNKFEILDTREQVHAVVRAELASLRPSTENR